MNVRVSRTAIHAYRHGAMDHNLSTCDTLPVNEETVKHRTATERQRARHLTCTSEDSSAKMDNMEDTRDRDDRSSAKGLHCSCPGSVMVW